MISVLEESIIHLLHHEPYYAHLLMRMRRYKVKQHPSSKAKKEDAKAPTMPDGKPLDEEQMEAAKFTAGVNITDAVNLYYNERWFELVRDKFGIATVAGILKHEAEHITFMHLMGREKGFDPKMHNIAADCSINQYNKFLEPWLNSGVGVTLKKVRELCENDKIEERQTTEYYYAHLQKKAEEKKNDPEFQKALEQMASEGDDHDMWEEGTNEEVAKQVAKYAVEQAVNSVGRGNVPGHLQKAIEAMNKETLNWKKIIRQFWSKGIIVEQKTTRMRTNRRYGIKQPGKRMNPLIQVALCIDTSGSMSDQMIDAIFVEAQRMHQAGATVDIIECDTKVHKIWRYNGKNENIQVNGRGGTSFEPALTAAAKLNPDAIIYFTDGDGEQDFKQPKVPTLWVLTTREGYSGTIPEKARKVWMKLS